MTTHVFIVDEETFPIHLKYMFAGTGFKEFDINLDNPKNISLKPAQEKTIIGLLSDIKRVRIGDKVIFYLIQTSKREGMFFGVFKIKEHNPIVFHEENGIYLGDLLKKRLIFRTLIAPEEVFSLGVTEWEALDDIKLINSPKNLIWSLIYRKLKGNRGCTPITNEESIKLIQMIRQKNENKIIQGDNLTFDKASDKIISDVNEAIEYDLTKSNKKLDILPLLELRYNQCRSHEVHLQSYITENAGENNPGLNKIVGTGKEILWLGNEVSCGVGMQRIDVFPITLQSNKKEFRVIELKCVYAFEDLRIIKQLKRYVDWTQLFIKDANVEEIQPIVVSKKIPDFCKSKKRKFGDNECKNFSIAFSSLINSFKEFNSKNNCKPIKFFEYEILSNKIVFQEVTYN